MPTTPNPYRQNLSRQAANYVALTPLSLLEWAADVFPGKLAVIHGDLRLTWSRYRERCHRLGSALRAIEQTCNHWPASNGGRSSGCKKRSALGRTIKVKVRSPCSSSATTTVQVRCAGSKERWLISTFSWHSV